MAKNVRKIGFFLLAFLTPLVMASTPWADGEVVENPLTANISFSPSRLAAGGNGTLNIDVHIVKGHKAYVDMFHITWEKPADFKIGAISAKPKFSFRDKFSKKTREAVKGDATISAPFEIPVNLSPGIHPVEVSFRYQVCSEDYCLFPKTLILSKNLETVAPEATITASIDDAETSDFERMLMKGMLYAFLFVFFAGVLTSLTPCIFPMIPITLAIIGARSSGRSRFGNFTISLAYVFGIAITYAILGVVAAKTGALFGSLLGHPVVVGFIALLFTVMALSMYGAFEIKVPLFISKKLSTTRTQAGYFGAFVTGLIAGIVASPCVGPVLVSILTWVARTQDTTLGFLLLFTFALGIGQLFLVLGTFSSLVNKLPKSGPWMNSVKFVFGTSMIAAALYFLFPILPHRVFDALFGVTLVLISGAYGAFDGREKLTNSLMKIRKAFMLSAFIMGVAFGVRGTLGINMDFSSTPDSSQKKTSLYPKLDWQPYSDELLQKAHINQMPVIIDFWADWCAACKELEILTFTQPEIQAASKSFVLLKINATKSTPEVKKLMDYYRVIGLPTMIFYGANGKILPKLRVTGFEKAEKFLPRMKTAAEAR